MYSLALVASTLALAPAVFGQGLFESSSLSRAYTRQLATANICATIDIDVPLDEITGDIINVPIADDVCLCLADGTLTPDSLETIDALVAANGTGVDLLTSLINGAVALTANALTDEIIAIVEADLGQQQTTCTYPTDAIPNSCGDCGYVCPGGTVLCGDACVDTSTTTCTSNVARKRDLTGGVKCAIGQAACAIPGSSLYDGKNFECIDVQANIESCGGCAFPLPGATAGVDCTAIPYTSGVGCSAGICVIQGCLDGYELNGNGTACISLDASASGSADVSAETATSLLDSLVGSAVKETIFQSRSAKNARAVRESLKRYQVDSRALRN